jgi:PKD repeat protein
VKAKKHDMSVREFFRKKLENAEIIPNASVSSQLMKKLARREFLRFNPFRFNIYYLGGILVTGIIAGIILFSGAGNLDQSTTLNISGEKRNTVSSGNPLVPGREFVIQKPETLKENSSESIGSKPIIRPKVVSVKAASQKIESRENNRVTQTAVNESFSKKGLLSGNSSEKNKLQSGFRKEEVLFEVSATEGCTPLKLHFNNIADSYDSCRWTFGDGGYSSEKNPQWIFDVAGEYKVVLNVFDSDGRQANSSAVITVHPKPVAQFEISPDKAVLPGDEIRFLNYSTNAVKYKWDFGDGTSSELFEPRHNYSKYGNYDVRMIVFSDYGCSDSLVVLNAFSQSEYFIDFPNAFIPNTQGPTGGYYSSKSDEAAQVFHPVSSGVSDYQLKIFSKLGILIFETSDISIGWDGYFKGQLAEPGVYIWKVRGNFRNGEPFIKMGDVTLLRN